MGVLPFGRPSCGGPPARASSHAGRPPERGVLLCGASSRAGVLPCESARVWRRHDGDALKLEGVLEASVRTCAEGETTLFWDIIFFKW